MFAAVAALAQLPGGSVFRRLSQEVEAAAAERHGGIKVYQLQVMWACCCASCMACHFCIPLSWRSMSRTYCTIVVSMRVSARNSSGSLSLQRKALLSTAHEVLVSNSWPNGVLSVVCVVPQPLFVSRSASALECQAVQLVSAVLMESAPNLPGTGAVSQQGGKQQQLPFAAEQLSAAEPHLVALQRLYQQETGLSVQSLRHPRMMQLLLSGGLR